MKSQSSINWVLFLALCATTALCWITKKRDATRPNYDFLPEAQMARSVAYDSFSPNPNFPDGLTLRSPPAGTLARSRDLTLHYQSTLEDALRAGQELRNPVAEDDPGRRERGSVIFANFCQVCHGPLGQGNGPITQGGFPPPASLSADRAVRMKDGQMFHVLTYGQGNMPPFSTQLSQADRWSVILYVRALQEPYAPSRGSSPIQEAAQLFRENCAACHGEDGKGANIRKVLPLIPDFTSLAWQISQSEMAIVNQIDYGSLPLMPSFRYKLPQEQILKLAVYVRSFAAHPAGPVPPSSHLTPTNIYGTYCFVCHDTNGKGNPQIRTVITELPDFTDSAWQKTRTDANMAQSILLGKGKFMLPMSDKLGAVDVNKMVALVRGFSGGKQVIALESPKGPGPPAPAEIKPPTKLLSIPATPSPKAEQAPLVAPAEDIAARIRVGATIFQQYCFVCHGQDGKGTSMRPVLPPIPDFTSPTFHKERSDAQLQVSILDGKGTLMPANRGRVTEEQAQDLVAYVRAFGPKGLVPAPAVPASSSDFEKSFRQLEDQWNELQRLLQKSSGQN